MVSCDGGFGEPKCWMACANERFVPWRAGGGGGGGGGGTLAGPGGGTTRGGGGAGGFSAPTAACSW